MAFDHRLPAIITALCSSIAVFLAAFSGASCNFLIRINGDENDELQQLLGINNSFGILCDHDIFSRDGDKMWELSRIFLIVGLTLGSTTAALAWAVASFLTPTNSNWTGISVLAALTAVLQVPIFVLFEAEPCLGDLEDIELFENATTGLGCKLGPGSYLLIASDILYVMVTCITQCFDRPKWGLELDLWKVHKKGSSTRINKSRNDEYYYDDNENYSDNVRLTGKNTERNDEGNGDNFSRLSGVLPAGKAKQELSHEKPKKPLGFFAKLFGSSSRNNMEIPVGMTKSMSAEEEYDYENQLLHDLEVVRISPLRNRPSSGSYDGEGREVSVGSFQRKLEPGEESANNRSFQSFNAVVESGTEPPGLKPSDLNPWLPKSGNSPASNIVEQHQMIDSPSASFLSMENGIPLKPVISSVTDILQDLRCEEGGRYATDYDASADHTSADHTSADHTSTDHTSTDNTSSAAVMSQSQPQPQQSPDVVMTFTPIGAEIPDPHTEGNEAPKPTPKNRSSDSKRPGFRNSLRNLNIFASKKSNGYAQMSSDQSDDDPANWSSNDTDSEKNYFNYYDGDEVQPGLQISLLETESPALDETVKSVLTHLTQSDGLDDEIKNIYDGLDTHNSILQSSQESEPIATFPHAQFDADFGAQFDDASVHSDPGLLLHDNSFEESTGFGTDFATEFTPFDTSGEVEEDSQDSNSIVDVFKVRGEENVPWDTQMLLDTLAEVQAVEASRGRPLGRYDAPRSRRPVSPVGSIRSHRSLLNMTIFEETEEDVKMELDIASPHRLKRTYSDPTSMIGGPISTRRKKRDKSTQELLKKLQRLKHSINTQVEAEREPTTSGLPPRDFPARKLAPLGLPPLSPSSDEYDQPSGKEFKADDTSTILSDLLKSDFTEERNIASINRLLESKNSPFQKEPEPSKVLDSVSPIDASASTSSTSAVFPSNLETNNDESWKEVVSPMKDTPSKESWKDTISPIKHTPHKEKWKNSFTSKGTPATMDATLDISDETSETDRTRSTISYDSDEDSYETGPRQIRSKSMGPAKRRNRKLQGYRASNSLSPARRKILLDGTSTASCIRTGNISNIARESRIRRLQQLRKGYMPLQNEHSRAESPPPYRKDPYGVYDPQSDSELTPKRRTVSGTERDEIMSDASSTDLPGSLRLPKLLQVDDDQSCPEFDNILDRLDLQLIDLNRGDEISL